MDFFTNTFILENFSKLAGLFIGAFLISFLITPLIGRLARFVGAIDLPAELRSKSDRSSASRMHTGIKLRLGGLAVAISFIAMLIISQKLFSLGAGVVIAVGIIMLLGYLDDSRELSGGFQIALQLLAAFVIVLSGISVTQINVLGQTINFDWISGVAQLGSFVYNFVFPADVLTILWIVGVINVINWVGGVDGLNISVSSIIALTILILALGSGNIELALVIAAFIGANVGLLMFNYNPSFIFPGAIGDYLNGLMLAVFAIVGGTSWNATIVLFGLPIIDALLVVFLRIKSNPEVMKNPLKILQISDKNHLHHRLIDVGYSRKMVLLIEVSIMMSLAAIAIYFTSIRRDVVAVFIGIAAIVILFTLVNYYRQRNLRLQRLLAQQKESQRVAEVKVILDESESDDYEKFAY